MKWNLIMMKNNALICYKKCHAMNDKPNVMIALNEVKIHLSTERVSIFNECGEKG